MVRQEWSDNGFQNLLYIRVTLESLFRHSLLHATPQSFQVYLICSLRPKSCISNKFPGDIDVASPGATLGTHYSECEFLEIGNKRKTSLLSFPLYLKYLWLISQMDMLGKHIGETAHPGQVP